MIGRIRGLLIEKKPPMVCVDVHGIGFQVLAPLSTCLQLPAVGEEVALFTEFVVTEDSQTLYGFMRESDKLLFQKVIKISGIGPKLALGILSGMEPHIFAQCVENNDITSLTKLPGVGKKTAERIVIELREKLQAWLVHETIGEYSSTALTTSSGAQAEAVAGLEALGYKPKEAQKAIAKVYEDGKSAEMLIKESLMGA